MRLFLLTFFVIYGGVHVYAFLKTKAALNLGPRTGIPLALFMVLMVLAPVIVRLSEKAGFETFARILSYAGYSWLGLLFLFISASFAIFDRVS